MRWVTLCLLFATAAAQTRCGGDVRPKCADGNSPTGCDDGSTTLPCPQGSRPVCSDGNNPTCPATGSTSVAPSATTARVGVTMLETATLAPPSSRTECPSEPPYFSVSVSTTSQGQPQVVTSSCPPYEKGWNNPADAYGQLSTFTIPKPVFAAQPIPVGKELTKYNSIMYLVDDGTALGGSLGIMKNGVQVFGRYSPCGFGSKCKTQAGCPSAARNCEVDASAPSNIVDAVDAESHTVDECGGHAAPTGGYHIHTFHSNNRSVCGDDMYLPHDTAGQHSELLGWMFDGFGIYGPNSQGGQAPTVLDDCNGHTHMIDGVMTYHYHFTGSYPWTIGCFKGCPDTSMVRGISNISTYGCPTGLTSDPSLLVEPVPNITGVTTTSGTTPAPAVTMPASEYPTTPDIVYIMLDDLGFGDVGYTQDSVSFSATPVLDAFAEDSLALSKFYASATCTPTRGALITGRYAHEIGLEDLTLGAAALYQLPHDMVTLPEALKSLGYSTGMVGKWHLGFSTPTNIPTGRGFDYHYGYYEGGMNYTSKVGGNPTNQYKDLQLNGEAVLNQTEMGTYAPDLWQYKAATWIGQPSPKPKFLYYAMQSVHSPIHTPPTTVTGCANVDYCNMLAYADARIGDLLAVLKASPRWNNTLVIITSDNGGSVPLGGSNTPFSGSKGTWLEGGVHLPGIIGGGILPANRRGSVYSRLAHVTDMYSTVLALASKGTYTKAADVDGVNLWPSIVSDVASARTTVLVGVTADQAAFIEGDFKLLVNVMIRGVTYDGLYNLSADVSESVDVSAHNTDRKARMVAMVAAHLAQSQEGDTRNSMTAAAAFAVQNNGYWGPWLTATDASTRSMPSGSTQAQGSTTPRTQCGGGIRPVCSDGKRPSKCTDGSTSLPCPTGARPICDDGNNATCPATGSTSVAPTNSVRTTVDSGPLAPPSSRTECPSEPPYFSVSVSTTSQGQPQVVTSSCPPYEKGWNNPADAYGQLSTFTIPKPVFAAQPIPVGKELTKYNSIMYLVDDGTALGGSLGIMKNGVQVFGRYSPCGFGSKCKTQAGCPSAARNCEVDASAPSNIVDAVDAESHTVDECGGHAAPTGGYHIHTFHSNNRSVCGDDMYLPHDMAGQHSELLGWMFDGFGIYGPNSQGGQAPTVLDDCNGHTHMIDGVMTYHYHFTGSYPWTIGCFKGCPDTSMVRGISSISTYGCPAGLTSDPSLLFEVPPATTISSTNKTTVIQASASSSTKPLSTMASTGAPSSVAGPSPTSATTTTAEASTSASPKTATVEDVTSATAPLDSTAAPSSAAATTTMAEVTTSSKSQNAGRRLTGRFRITNALLSQLSNAVIRRVLALAAKIEEAWITSLNLRQDGRRRAEGVVVDYQVDVPADESVSSVLSAVSTSLTDGSFTNQLSQAVPALTSVDVNVLVEPSLSSEEPSASKSSNQGAIIGGSIAAALVVMLAAVAAIVLRKRSRTGATQKDHISLTGTATQLTEENPYTADCAI